MRWIQIMLFQKFDRIELNIDDEICEIESERILSNDYIENFISSLNFDSKKQFISCCINVGQTSMLKFHIYLCSIPRLSYWSHLVSQPN